MSRKALSFMAKLRKKCVIRCGRADATGARLKANGVHIFEQCNEF
jgi:hypothetical protein